ncbi:MAG: hypothetical protein JWN25_3338, partial [Verrucomicrobiales bacterium]|nr:hypothetical protein [Verrucomicrobiales bacterium]
MAHVAQGIFRVVGHLVEDSLTVEYVRHCDELSAATPPPGGKSVSIRDDLWIDRVPVAMVAIQDRMPS